MIGSHAWLWYALLSAFFAALTALFAKIGVSRIDADYATFLRTVVVLIFLTFTVLVSGKWQNPLALSRWSMLALLLSGLATGLSWLFYFRALKVGNASVVAPIDKLSVVFVAIVSVVILGEKLQWGQWLGVALIVLGSMLVAVMGIKE